MLLFGGRLLQQTIGILAGMGPRSTAPFIDLVITECQLQYGAKDDIDFPKMMIHSVPTPFYADRPTDHVAMENAIRTGLQDLERTGVTSIAIACNTAHVYYPQLAKSINLPLLNMVELSLDTLHNSTKKVALIAARPTVESEIYQMSLRKRGYEFIDLDWQSDVDNLIKSTRTTNNPSFFKNCWNELTTMADKADVDTIIIACMDLSAIINHIESKLSILDTGRCLAHKLVKDWLQHSSFSATTKFMQWKSGSFVISTEKSRLQLNRVHQFLSSQAYWCLNISYEIVEKSAQDSLCFGLFDEQHDGHPQIGYARIVTDHTTFAWLCDVYVEPAYRGIGLSKWLMNCLMEHPSMKGLRRICLATKDAHSLYSQYGFEVTQTPNSWMEIKNNNLYQKR